MLRAIGASVIGPAHILEGRPNQDAILVRRNQGGWFLAVADGLGSRTLSHIGARMAVQVARESLGMDVLAAEPREAIQRFYRSWLKAIPTQEPGTMATTLLIASCGADGRCRIVQLGDGLAMYRAGGHFGLLTEVRTGFGNETDALGVTKSFSAWRYQDVVLSEVGDGVILMTDGLADDLVPERLDSFFSWVIGEAAKRSRRNGRKWLEQQMTAWPTALHADDKSIGLILRGDR